MKEMELDGTGREGIGVDWTERQTDMYRAVQSSTDAKRRKPTGEEGVLTLQKLLEPMPHRGSDGDRIRDSIFGFLNTDL